MYITRTRNQELIGIGMSTVRVSTQMKSRLARISARLTLQDGRTRSMEEILGMLADAYDAYENAYVRTRANIEVVYAEMEKKLTEEFMDSYKKTGVGKISEQTKHEMIDFLIKESKKLKEPKKSK